MRSYLEGSLLEAPLYDGFSQPKSYPNTNVPHFDFATIFNYRSYQRRPDISDR